MNVTGDLIDCYFRYILMLQDPEISVAVIFICYIWILQDPEISLAVILLAGHLPSSSVPVLR